MSIRHIRAPVALDSLPVLLVVYVGHVSRGTNFAINENRLACLPDRDGEVLAS